MVCNAAVTGGDIIAAMSSPPLRSLAAVFARHGNTTFGGGSATIATLHGLIVTKREWVSQQQFDLSYALSTGEGNWP